MEQTGTIPRGLVEVSEWSELFEGPGPVATVCIGTPAATENASHKNLLRWQAARRDLEGQGAPAVVTDVIEELIADAHQLGEGLAVYADRSGVLHATHSPVVPRNEIVRWDSLPSLRTLVEWRQHQPPYVVALVDHRGADLFASGGESPDRVTQAGESDRYPVARNQPGGWSQRRYQQHALENWAESAREVADALTELADRTSPEIILVGGDPRSVELLLGALPGPVVERTEQVTGTRAADGDGDHSAREVARMVETVAASHTVSLLEEFRLHLGRGDRAVEGVGPTMEALRQARVAALLFHDDPADRRRASFGAEPTLVAATSAQLEGVGGGPIGEGRLTDVALRAAAGSGAGVRVVPSAGGPKEGLGALLRWDD